MSRSEMYFTMPHALRVNGLIVADCEIDGMVEYDCEYTPESPPIHASDGGLLDGGCPGGGDIEIVAISLWGHPVGGGKATWVSLDPASPIYAEIENWLLDSQWDALVEKSVE